MLLALFILVLRAVVLTKLVIQGMSFLFSFILALIEVLVAMLVISAILSSIFLILELYTSFLTTLFLLDHLVYLNQLEKLLIYQHLFLSSLLFVLLKLFGTFLNSSISNLPTLDFRLARSAFLWCFYVSTPVALFKSIFVA